MQSDTLVESLVNIILYQPYKRDLWFWYLLLYILTVNRIKLIVLICSLFLNNESYYFLCARHCPSGDAKIKEHIPCLQTAKSS